MTALGDLGVAHDAPEPIDDLAFGWFGVEVRVNPYFEALSLVDFASALSSTDEGPLLQRLAAVKAAFVPLIHEQDFGPFWKAAIRNHQTVEDLAAVAWKLVEAITERPTVRPSSSSDGRPSTPESSAPEATSTEQAVRTLVAQGRPDMAVALIDQDNLPDYD